MCPTRKGRTLFAASGVAQACGVPHCGATCSRLAAKIAPKPTAVKRVNINDLWYYGGGDRRLADPDHGGFQASSRAPDVPTLSGPGDRWHRPGRRTNQKWESIGFRVVAIDLGCPVRFSAAALDTFDSRPGPMVFRLGAGSLAAAARDRRLRGPALALLAVPFEIDDFTHNRHGLRSSGPERIVCPTVRLSLA